VGSRRWMNAWLVTVMVRTLWSATEVSAESWKRAYVDALPDEAFAVVHIQPDGTKSRHLPHHDADGLVDDDDMRILEHDDRRRLPSPRPGGLDPNFLSFGEAEGGIGEQGAVDEHLTVLAEALGARPGKVLVMSPHERGEGRAGLVSGYDENSLHQVSGGNSSHRGRH